MIISRTPLRISFFSGGSDMPNFYEKEKGAALSVTINKYIYVMMHKTPHLGIKIMYDTIEEFPDLETMQHAITRESLKHFGIDHDPSKLHNALYDINMNYKIFRKLIMQVDV